MPRRDAPAHSIASLAREIAENTRAVRELTQALREDPDTRERLRRAARKAAVKTATTIVEEAKVAEMSNRLTGVILPPPLPPQAHRRARP